MGTWVVALCAVWPGAALLVVLGRRGSVCGSESAGWVLVSVLLKTNLAVWKVTRHLILHRLLMEPSSPVALCQVP